MTHSFPTRRSSDLNAADNPASPMAEAGREVRAEYAKIDGEVTGELALYLGPYLPILGARLDTAINPFVGVLMSMLETLPLMMLGMALFRNGFLTGDRKSTRLNSSH